MKKHPLAILLISLLVLAAPAAGLADTTVSEPTWSQRGGFMIATITLTADVAGGAVTDEEVDLSLLWDGKSAMSRLPWFFYFVKEASAAATAPDAYTLVFKDKDDEAAVLSLADTWAAGIWADAAEDMPNYWPVTDNLLLSAGDIGASNIATIKLYFLK